MESDRVKLAGEGTCSCEVLDGEDKWIYVRYYETADICLYRCRYCGKELLI